MAKKTKPVAAPKLAADAESKPQFELDGKKYNVLHGVMISTDRGYEKLTAADICVNEEAQKQLVATGSTALQEVFE